jgi:hypothetical protein
MHGFFRHLSSTSSVQFTIFSLSFQKAEEIRGKMGELRRSYAVILEKGDTLENFCRRNGPGAAYGRPLDEHHLYVPFRQLPRNNVEQQQQQFHPHLHLQNENPRYAIVKTRRLGNR